MNSQYQLVLKPKHIGPVNPPTQNFNCSVCNRVVMKSEMLCRWSCIFCTKRCYDKYFKYQLGKELENKKLESVPNLNIIQRTFRYIIGWNWTPGQ